MAAGRARRARGAERTLETEGLPAAAQGLAMLAEQGIGGDSLDPCPGDCSGQGNLLPEDQLK